jgi:CBS domain-containing protein
MICPTCNFDNLPGCEVCYNCLHDLTQHDRPTPRDRVQESLMRDTVGHLRPRPAVKLPPDATVGEAMRTMLENNIGAVVVVDADERLLGIFSERDLLTRVALAGPDYAGRPVVDFMTPGPTTVSEAHTLDFALREMDGGGYRHLPVVRDGRVVGMISVRDLLRHMTRQCRGACW